MIPAHSRWWATRGERATTRREQEWEVLQEPSNRFRAQVIHVFDRGFAGQFNSKC